MAAHAYANEMLMRLDRFRRKWEFDYFLKTKQPF